MKQYELGTVAAVGPVATSSGAGSEGQTRQLVVVDLRAERFDHSDHGDRKDCKAHARD